MPLRRLNFFGKVLPPTKLNFPDSAGFCSDHPQTLRQGLNKVSTSSTHRLNLPAQGRFFMNKRMQKLPGCRVRSFCQKASRSSEKFKNFCVLVLVKSKLHNSRGQLVHGNTKNTEFAEKIGFLGVFRVQKVCVTCSCLTQNFYVLHDSVVKPVSFQPTHAWNGSHLGIHGADHSLCPMV